ncbi:MAG: hypothetical protein JWL70_2280 [Acidimicrobiia bacterium]|nr:hypothetical protein [Acidimicrobiia bacterium]
MAATSPSELPAGRFSAWVTATRLAIRGEAEADVPCGTCTACCASSQFVHIGPEETDSLAHIPPALLFPAPQMPKGNVLMGYDEHGRCPMLTDIGCSIYEHRPRTCRTYDCRVFPATGVSLDGDDKPLIADQAKRWRFALESESDRIEQAAVRAAAKFVQERREVFRDGIGPTTPTQVAVLAVEISRTFEAGDPSVEDVRTAIARRRSTL